MTKQIVITDEEYDEFIGLRDLQKKTDLIRLNHFFTCVNLLFRGNKKSIVNLTENQCFVVMWLSERKRIDVSFDLSDNSYYINIFINHHQVNDGIYFNYNDSVANNDGWFCKSFTKLKPFTYFLDKIFDNFSNKSFLIKNSK